MAAVTKRVSNPNEEEIELRRGPWTIEEDTLLIHYISTHGEGHWNSLAKCAGLKRTGKSCRLRWLNYLKPDIKRGNLTPQEQLTILELHSKWGNRWSKIAQHLPGRTDNEIKNYWRTRVQKQARQLNIESNSKRFLDAVRCFWMPTLIQKMEQNSSQSSSSPSLSANYSSSVPCVSLQASPSAEATQMSDYPMNFGNSNCVTNPPRNILCSDSLISQQPQPIAQMSDYPAPDESYYSYEYDMGMEGLTMDPAFAMGSFDNSQFGCQVGATDWTTDSLWNMDGM